MNRKDYALEGACAEAIQKGNERDPDGPSRTDVTVVSQEPGPPDSRTMPMHKPRVIIADDHRLVVAGLERLLVPDCDVIATAYDIDTLKAQVVSLRPEIVVLDIWMPPHSGLDVIPHLRGLNPTVGVIVVTMNDDPAIAAEAFRVGASAYVLKNCAASELLDAVRHVKEQHAYVTPLVAGGIIDSLMKRPHHREGDDELTYRQREVLRLLADGKSMKEVAEALNLTVRTVAFHKYRMMKQLKIKTSAELVRFAVARHIV
jgi:DNA-binding NarL/FixJ family response regulator